MQNSVAIYIRVSTLHQIDKDSIPMQREALINYTKYILNTDRYQIFEDAGFSGKNTDRPAYQDMMAAIREKRFTHLLVYKIDRISRNLLDFAQMYEELKSLGVIFISKTEQFDTSTAMGEAMLKIILVFAELERKMTSERVTATMLSRATDGKWNGGRVPYGYDYHPETGKFTLNPSESPVVEEIYRLYEEHRSLTYIARFLNSSGLRTRFGNEWGPVSINKILRNKFYTGTYEYNRLSAKTGKQVPNSPDKLIEIDNHHPAIISDEQQKTVIRILENNRSLQLYTGKVGRIHVFSGLLYCGNCGRALTSSTTRKMADGLQHSMYLCPTKKHTSDKRCRNVRESKVGPFIINFIRNILLCRDNPVAMQSLQTLQTILLSNTDSGRRRIDNVSLSQFMDYLKNPQGHVDQSARRTWLQKRKVQLESALERLTSLYILNSSPMTQEEYLEHRSKIQYDYNQTCELLEGLTEKQISDENFNEAASQFILKHELSRSDKIDYAKLRMSIDPKLLRQFFTSLIESIYIGSDGKISSVTLRNGLQFNFI